jgi:glycosyltransferase involved in cell wall biosynthesis
VASELGLIQAYVKRLQRPDLVWVPCFRQRDMHSAVHFARKWDVPLIFDPLISWYQKEAYERGKWTPGSRRAEKRKQWERRLFESATKVVLENPAYVDFVHSEMGVARNKLEILYTAAFTDIFRPAPAPKPVPPFSIGFVGSFQPSMGTNIIVEAARLSQDTPCRWILIGEGDTKPEAERRAGGLANVEFVPWVPYEAISERMAQMHMLLGIFGATHKTDIVIPNKIFEAMAIARPLITQTAASYAGTIGGTDIIGWVPGGDPRALADKVRQWIAEPDHLPERGAATRKLYDLHFSPDIMRGLLANIIDNAVKDRQHMRSPSSSL